MNLKTNWSVLKKKMSRRKTCYYESRKKKPIRQNIRTSFEIPSQKKNPHFKPFTAQEKSDDSSGLPRFPVTPQHI